MTTDIAYAVAPDIFLDNPVYAIPMDRPRLDCVVSAAVLALPGRDHALGSGSALARVLSDVRLRLPDLRPYLVPVAFHKAPIGAVARHLALWRRIERDGPPIPAGRRGNEKTVDRPDGVLLYAELALDEVEAGDLARFMRAHAPYLIFAEGDAAILRDAGQWLAGPKVHFLPQDALDTIARGNALFVVLHGEYDDPEAGCIVFGRPDRIERLVDAKP